MALPRQPEVNIGMVGHVDHGKTTLTQALTGKWTDEHSEELKRGITIRLGYADAGVYRCDKHEGAEAFTTRETCPADGSKAKLIRAFSVVDAPGHETLMATMLSGASIMDGAILLVAANEPCPQPQTKEHLMALDLVGIKNIVVVQNKVDIVTKERALKSHEEIKRFVEGTVAQDAPVIPVCAQKGVNVDALLQALEERIPTPKRDATLPPRMLVARSFDVNRPGTRPKELRGGVVGGSLVQGQFKAGDEIEISPGIMFEEHGKKRWEPLMTEVTGLMAGGTTRATVGPGGLIGIGTRLDPALTKADHLTGRVVGKPGTLPTAWHSFDLETKLLDRVVGTEQELQVEPIRTRERLMLNVGTATTVGEVSSARGDVVSANLALPVCAEPGARVAISRRVGTRWRLIGHGRVQG